MGRNPKQPPKTELKDPMQFVQDILPFTKKDPKAAATTGEAARGILSARALQTQSNASLLTARLQAAQLGLGWGSKILVVIFWVVGIYLAIGIGLTTIINLLQSMGIWIWALAAFAIIFIWRNQ